MPCHYRTPKREARSLGACACLRERAIGCIATSGAGPGGGSAALHAARKGLSVIIVEDHKEIGVPVHCGECISEIAVNNLQLDIPEEVIYHMERIELDNYRFLFWFSLAINFIIPALFLMSRDAKRNKNRLIFVCIVVLPTMFCTGLNFLELFRPLLNLSCPEFHRLVKPFEHSKFKLAHPQVTPERSLGVHPAYQS